MSQTVEEIKSVALVRAPTPGKFTSPHPSALSSDYARCNNDEAEYCERQNKFLLLLHLLGTYQETIPTWRSVSNEFESPIII
jgi:hypothetical protein